MAAMKKKKPMAMPTKKMKGMKAPVRVNKDSLSGATHSPGSKGNMESGDTSKLLHGGKGSQKSLGGTSPKLKIKISKSIGNDNSKTKGAVRNRKEKAPSPRKKKF